MRKNLCRLGREFLKRRQEVQNYSNVKEATRKEYAERWINKETLGFLQSQLQRNHIIGIPKTNKWLRLRLTSHIEGYLIATQEEELTTKETQKRREKDTQKRHNIDVKCRVCDQVSESVYHLVCSCPTLAPSLYLNKRHNQIAKVLYQELIQCDRLILNPPARGN